MGKNVTFVTLAVLVCAAVTGSAQSVQGVVTGNVYDATGAVVPKASLTLTNDGTSITQTESTGPDGGFRFGLVPPGTYTLSVKVSGFNEKQIKGIIVEASRTVPVNVTLAVATATATVDVEASETLVQTATSDLTLTINQNTLANTALLTRNVFDLAFAAPSVLQGMNAAPASGGARESGTAYLLNGADNNDNFSEGGINVIPPLESVAEFTLLTNNMSAQYGRGGGA